MLICERSVPITFNVTPADLHPDEVRRLRALRDLGILDTAEEERFDRIARLTALVLGVPIALVSLVDEHRQWFKARVGLTAKETSRNVAFCAHAILENDEGFEVDDALLDERFADNPLVTGQPNIRFYAGHVIHDTTGLPLGTLCAIDTKPRHLTDEQRQALADLAALAEVELARTSERDLLLRVDGSERHKSIIFDTVSEGIVYQDRDGRIVSWNPAAEAVLGLSSAELGGLTCLDPRWRSIHEDGSPFPGEEHPAPRVLATGVPVRGEIIGIHKPNGELSWIRVNSQPVVNDEGATIAAVTAFTDVTAEHNLLRSLRRFRHLFQHANDIITVIDAVGNVLYASPSGGRVLGYPSNDSLTHGVLGIIHPDDLVASMARLRDVVGGKDLNEPFIVRVRSHSGEWMQLECVVVNLLNEPAVHGLVITSRDVTDRQRLAEQLAHRAAHDELTNLPNRRRLATRVSEALARAGKEGRSIALCFIDLDGFKDVNDTYGHVAGDDLLVAVADGIRSVVRPTDAAARVGGDEFIVVFDPVASVDEAMYLASRLRERIIVSSVEGLPPGAFGASVGLALSRADDTPTSVMQRADSALYRAKVQRGRVESADEHRSAFSPR